MQNILLNKFKIGVFMGGPSYEHDVSLESGEAVCKALQEEGLNVKAIALPRNLDIDNNTEAILGDIIEESEIDLVFNLLHGKFGEDGCLQTILDKIGIPYTGSKAKASYLAMDKIVSRMIFREASIAVPRSVVLKKSDRLTLDLSFPAVVKPAMGGSSIGVSIVDREENLPQAVRAAFFYDDRVIVEEYIEGEEITVGIIEDKPLPVIQIVPAEKFYNFKAKYEDSATDYLLPAPIAQHLQERAQVDAIKAHKSIGCSSFSRVDMILSKEGIPVVLELNTIPGLTNRSLLPKAAKADNISFSQMCVKILESAFGAKQTDINLNVLEKTKA